MGCYPCEVTSTPITLDSLLVVREGYWQGRPCLRGTGITVHQIAVAYLMGLTSEDICAENQDLDPSLFHAALAYYFANREQVEADLDEDDQQGTAIASQHPMGISSESHGH